MEKVFYKDPQITISSERILTARLSIDPEKAECVLTETVVPPTIGWPLLCLIAFVTCASVSFCLGNVSSGLAFCGLAMGCAIAGVLRAPTLRVWVVVSGQEVLVLATCDREFAIAVVNAVNCAINYQPR